MTYRTTGLATYRNYDFFGLIEGLNFAAQYQGKNERTDNSHLYGADYTRANGDGFGISSTYVYDGFGIGAVYTKSDRTNAQERAAAGFAPIFPDICYHLTHYKPAAADIPVASDNPAHYADAIRYNARTPLQGSLLPLTRLVWA
ncbi:putative outer membrane porin protein [Shigella sonnei]|nr:putative outer membrane porin protein [Shigella sonnei]